MSSFLPDILALFFISALVVRRFGVDLSFAQPSYQLMTYILLLTIGLKGGQALAEQFSWALVFNALLVMLLGLVITVVAMVIIRHFSTMNNLNRTVLAAHYGSVSVGTFAVAISFLELKGIDYNPELALYVALLELPAIILGLIWINKDKAQKAPLAEVFKHQSLALLIIGMLIGALYGEVAAPMVKQLQPVFAIMLALYLVHMGATAGGKLKDFGENQLFLICFALFMPLIGAAFGLGLGLLLGLNAGGLTLLATLAASSSYIAVPAVFEQATPNANVSQALVASLAITFSFNVIWGIPLYHHISTLVL